VVVDEFGGAEGIVTLEDIIEEIVEDIADEYDAREAATQWMRRLGERDYLVSARIDPGALADELGIELPRGQYASLAGFLLERVHDVPAVGATIHYKKVTFTIQRGSARVIEEVRVRW
jgi:putative hemolysin